MAYRRFIGYDLTEKLPDNDLNKAISEDRAAHGKKPLKFNGDEFKEEEKQSVQTQSQYCANTVQYVALQ